MTWEALPGADLVQQGLDDLAAGRVTVAALLISVGASKLTGLGLSVVNPIPEPEHLLWAALADDDPDAAHGRYNALIRRLVSFERALACAA